MQALIFEPEKREESGGKLFQTLSFNIKFCLQYFGFGVTIRVVMVWWKKEGVHT